MGATVVTQGTTQVRASFRLQTVKTPWYLLYEVLFCGVPAATCVFVGHPQWGARYLSLSVLILLGYHAINRQRYEFTTLAVGMLPMVLLLRGMFFYYSVLVFLGGGMLLFLRDERKSVKQLWNDLTWRYLTIFGLVFWWLSVLMTGEKTTNIRFFELVMASACVVLLARKRSYLGVALFGMWISTNLLAIGMLPYGDRLGMAEIDETRLGNPILLGVPSALILLVSVADRGRWMLLQNRPILRLIVPLAMAQWLILSGSRGSWITALTGLVFLLVMGGRDRKTIFMMAGLAALAVTIWISTARGARIAEQFSKTVDSDRTLANRTSGRSEQWKAIPFAFAESPIWGWGPGTGKDVAARYTGRHLGWHALYLQIIGETGLIGVSCLVTFLGSLIIRGLRHRANFGENVPLLSTVTYIAVGVSVSAIDATCGVLVGLALLGRDLTPRLRLTRVRRVVR